MAGEAVGHAHTDPIAEKLFRKKALSVFENALRHHKDRKPILTSLNWDGGPGRAALWERRRL